MTMSSPFRPAAEALEGREVPATLANGVTWTYDAAAKVLTVQGTAGDDRIGVSLDKKGVVVLGASTAAAPSTVNVRLPGVRHTTPGLVIRIHGGDGDDRLATGLAFGLTSSPARAELYGDAGDDDLMAAGSGGAGAGFAPTLFGGDGDDRLTVSQPGQNATLIGGAGDDYLIATRPDQAATLDGGAGDDNLFILGPSGNQRLVLRGGDGRDSFLSHTRLLNGVRFEGHTFPQFLALDSDFVAGEDRFANTQGSFGTIS